MSNTSLASLHDRSEPPALLEGGHHESGCGLAGLFLILLCIIHAGMNVWWLQADNHTIRTDEEGHMLLARTYHETLFVAEYPGPVQRIIAMSEIGPGNPAHPPLFHALGAFMIAFFGYSTDTMALTNTVLFIVLLLGCHALCRTFLDPWQSLFAVFVVSMTPMVYGSSRFFMTDFAAAAITVWAVVALIRSDGFHRAPWVFFFGLLTGLGLLTRTITFAYLLFPALLAVLVGLMRVFASRKSTYPDAPSLGTWAVNMVMALTVMAGVCAPWYYTNLEPFYGYWANKRIGETRGPLTSFVPVAPAPSAAPAPSTAPAVQPEGGVVITPPDMASPSLDYAWEKVRNPAVAWIRYPVYLVNNGLFIPLAALALLGMLTAWWRKQCRVPAILYLFAWIFGSWLFFTLFLRAGTPRYGLPVVPALSLFAALFILVLPNQLLRHCAGVLLIFVLCFQYGNMTVQSYGEFGSFTVAAPVPALQKESRHFIDDGLVLYKDHLTLSDAYGHLGAPRADNYKDRYFEIMGDHEAALPERPGKVARYQKLRLRGMPLYERHYWPGDNPYRLASLAPGDVPERAFTLIHMGLEPEHLLTLLPETDYILYEANATQADQVAAWEAYFGERGFESIATFDVPAFGWVPKTINGVLARKPASAEVPATQVTAESIGAMNLYELHELNESADFAQRSPELQALGRTRFETLLSAIATPIPLNPAVTFMAAEMGKGGENQFHFRLIFRVNQVLDRDWRVLFRGNVAEEAVSRLPPANQADGYVDWSFDPEPPTRAWQPERYVILSHSITAEPMVYQFDVGLIQDSEIFGETAQLKPLDLGAMP